LEKTRLIVFGRFEAKRLCRGTRGEAEASETATRLTLACCHAVWIGLASVGTLGYESTPRSPKLIPSASASLDLSQRVFGLTHSALGSALEAGAECTGEEKVAAIGTGLGIQIADILDHVTASSPRSLGPKIQ